MGRKRVNYECIVCKKFGAKFPINPEDFGLQAPVFCTATRCALEFACQRMKNKYKTCQKHMLTFKASELCVDCEYERLNQITQSNYILERMMPTATEEKEVVETITIDDQKMTVTHTVKEKTKEQIEHEQYVKEFNRDTE
jgi:hypothetical protein